MPSCPRLLCVKYIVYWGLVFTIVPQLALGSVWHVEKDGTGDFLTIPDALYHCQEGDTIRIGPGRFNDLTPPHFCGIDDDAPVRAAMTKNNIVLIGAGADSPNPNDSTIIGPDQPVQPDGEEYGIYGAEFCSAPVFSIESIRFENLNKGIAAWDVGDVSIRNCAFSGNSKAINLIATEVEVLGCDFFGGEYFNYHISILSGVESGRIQIKGSNFYSGGFPRGMITAGGAYTLYLDDCHFLGDPGHLDNGIGFYGSINEAFISNCTFTDLSLGLGMVANNRFHVSKCCFTNMGTGILDDGRSPNVMYVDECEFVEMQKCSIEYWMLFDGYVRNSILDKGERFVIQSRWNDRNQGVLKNFSSSEKGEFHFDMTDNWWGTANPDSIQAWIEDGADVPDYPFIVDWDPFQDSVSPNSDLPLDKLKSLFR